MNRRKFLATAAAAPAAAILGGRFARAEDHLKWAVFTPDSEVTFRTVMKPFAETVQRETNNAVVFDLFPNGALGRNPGQQPQMVVDGVADLAWVIPSYSPGRFPDTEVLELPGMFKNLRESSLVASGLAAGNVLKDYGDFYIVGLWGTAPYSIHTNFPVNSIADLKGKTIRASSKNESAALRAFGAVPIGMPVTEIPEAISRGTISGTTSHMSPFFDFGLDRVTNNHFFIGLGVVPLTVVMNKKKFDALPESARAIIERNAGPALTKVWIKFDHQLQCGKSREAKEQSETQGRVSFPGRSRPSAEAVDAGSRAMGGGQRPAQGTQGGARLRAGQGAGRAEGLRRLSPSARHPKGEAVLHSRSPIPIKCAGTALHHGSLFCARLCRARWRGWTVSLMARIDRTSKLLAQALAVLGLGALLCFAVMTMADGFLRFFFARPIDAVRDVGGLVAAFAVACCIPVAIVERSNITIRFLSAIIGPRAGRIADVAAAILVEIVLILMTWQFVVFANQAWATGTATWMLRIPSAPVWGAIAVILGISALLQIVVGVQILRGDYPNAHPEITG